MQVAELIKAIAALIWPIVIGGVVLALLPIVRKLLSDSSSFEIEIAGNRVGVQRATDESRKLIEDLQDRINTLEQGLSAPAAPTGGNVPGYPPIPPPPLPAPGSGDPYAPWPPYPSAPPSPAPAPGGPYGAPGPAYGGVPGGYGGEPGSYGGAPGGYGGVPGDYGSVPGSENDERAETEDGDEVGVPASGAPPVTQGSGTPAPPTAPPPMPVPPQPRPVPPSGPWAVPAPAARPPISTGKLLWVDDELDANVYERARAVEAGYSVIQARSTAEALHLLDAEGPVDLVVSDMARVERGGSYNPRAGLELVQAMRGAGNPTTVILYSSPESMAPVEHTVCTIPGVLHTSSPSRLAAMLQGR